MHKMRRGHVLSSALARKIIGWQQNPTLQSSESNCSASGEAWYNSDTVVPALINHGKTEEEK
jgi:hypothetical protein